MAAKIMVLLNRAINTLSKNAKKEHEQTIIDLCAVYNRLNALKTKSESPGFYEYPNNDVYDLFESD